MRISLIDADSILWAAAWLNRDNSDSGMILAIDNFISDLLERTKATHYIGLLKNPTEIEFRRIMFPSYKANRPPTPEWLSNRRPIILEHLTTKWQFVHTERGFEVDDAIASIQYQMYYQHPIIIDGIGIVPIPIVCSVDKDMKQISGWNYNPKTKELVFIGGDEAERNLLTQILTGDVTDNIKGVPGIGPAKAKKILEGLIDGDSISKVYDTYFNHHGQTAQALLDFAENVLQVVMRRDASYPYKLVEVPKPNVEKYFE